MLVSSSFHVGLFLGEGRTNSSSCGSRNRRESLWATLAYGSVPINLINTGTSNAIFCYTYRSNNWVVGINNISDRFKWYRDVGLQHDNPLVQCQGHIMDNVHHGQCVGISCHSATCNCEWWSWPRSLRGGWRGSWTYNPYTNLPRCHTYIPKSIKISCEHTI